MRRVGYIGIGKARGEREYDVEVWYHGRVFLSFLTDGKATKQGASVTPASPASLSSPADQPPVFFPVSGTSTPHLTVGSHALVAMCSPISRAVTRPGASTHPASMTATSMASERRSFGKAAKTLRLETRTLGFRNFTPNPDDVCLGGD